MALRNFLQTLKNLAPEKRRALPRLFRRWEKWTLMILVFSFGVSATLLSAAVVDTFSIPVASQGGELREGIVGIPRFINPLLAASDADRDLVSLIYTGLMRFDGKGNIVPSLAERYTISDNGLLYTFSLRKDARWSDGVPLRADDIVFTVSLAKNPAYRSSLRPNWEGVTVEKIDDYTVSFTLIKQYAPFLENTTLGIIPKHIWEQVPPLEFNLSEHNTIPIGAGPYKISSLEKDAAGRVLSYVLISNSHYLPREPYISNLTVSFFPTPHDLVSARVSGYIDSASPVNASLVADLEQKGYYVKQLPLPRVFGVFFNQNASTVLADSTVRQALELAIDRPALVAHVLANQGIPAYDPIPPGTFGSRTMQAEQPRLANPAQARALLEADGWQRNDANSFFQKKSRDTAKPLPLSFALSAPNTPDITKTADLLVSMWKEIGAEVTVAAFEIGDLEEDVLRPRKYDAVLFGQGAGFDPDPFAFWHSSQRNDPGLNIAMYTNPKADMLLEEARKNNDAEKRRELYRAFQELIAVETPALFLYSPFYLYMPAQTAQNIAIDHITLPADRFGSVHEWYMQTKNKWNGFVKNPL